MTKEMKGGDIGLIGLGVMGLNLAQNIAENGFSVIGHDVSSSMTMSRTFLDYSSDLKGFVKKLKKPRKIMLLVPAGQTVEEVIDALLPYLEPKDLIVDAGNSHFEDTLRRSKALETQNINFFGLGISGGEAGARNGASLMGAGDPNVFESIRPILEAVAARDEHNNICALRLGNSPEVGHFVKMVHNSIEYAEMQLISEVYSQFSEIKDYSNERISDFLTNWRSDIEGSFLLDVTSQVLTVADEVSGVPLIDMIEDIAEQKGTGKWGTVSAINLGVAAPTLFEAVSTRFLSQYKTDRLAASEIYAPKVNKSDVISNEIIKNAFSAAKICAFAQGFQLLAFANLEYSWNMKLREIAQVWKAGCILRGNILDKIIKAFDKNASLTNLLLDDELSKKLKNSIGQLRLVVSEGALCGLPLPAHTSSLSYFDAYTKARLPINLVQAQRDFFGSHGYQRIDKQGTFHSTWVN